jgi:hypothetical protein
MKPTITDNEAIKSDTERGPFAKKVFELRIRKNFTQQSVAGVSEAYIRRVENQNHQPSEAMIVRLAAAYGYDAPAQLEELKQLANQQAKGLAQAPIESVSGKNAIQRIPKAENRVKIDLSRFSTELPPFEVDYDSIKNFGHFLDEVYMMLGHHKLTQPYNYGTTWLLKDKSSAQVYLNLRILERFGPDYPVRDTRSLIEVGISPGMELEAIPLVGHTPLSYGPNTKMLRE